MLIGDNFIQSAHTATGLPISELEALPLVYRNELELFFIEEYTGCGSPQDLRGLLIPRRFPNKQCMMEELRKGVLADRKEIEGECAKNGLPAPSWEPLP